MTTLKQWWNDFLQQPRIHSMFLRLAPQLTFIKARMSPKNFLGLHLTVGIFIIICAVGLFGVIANDVISGGRLTIADANVAAWLHAHSTPVLTQCMLILTHLHDPIVISLIVFLIAIYLVLRKRWYEVLTVVLVVEGGMLLNLFVKSVFQRVRPSFEPPLVILSTYSFPSGHVAATTLFYGVLAALLITRTPSWTRAVCILLMAFTMVVMVAFSRLYLGAHYLSDVLAAFFEGIAWLALCLMAVHIVTAKKWW